MKGLGDFDASAVVYGKFSTFRPSTGAAYTLGGTPALSVYKDNSTTQSTTGVTLTADFDSVTGLNHFAVDTSADGTFYSAGSYFDVVITTGTVDSVSVVGAVVASFTIRKNSALKPTTAGRTLVVDASGLADANVVKLGPTGSGTAQTARDIGASVLLSSGTGTGQLNFTSGVVQADAAKIGGTTQTPTDVGGTVTSSATTINSIYSAVDTEVAAIKAKTDNLPASFPSNFASLGINASGHISRVTLTDTLTTYTGNTVQTGDVYANLPTNLSRMRILSDGSVVDWLGLSPPPLFSYPWAGNPDKTIYVDPSATGANDGTTPEDAYTTTAAAIADINALNRTTYYGVLIRHSGTESIGTSTLRFPIRTVVQCSYSSASTYTGAGPTAPCMVSADDDVWIYGGLTITCTTANAIRLPIGYMTTQASSKRVLVENVTTNNMSDGCYFGAPTGTSATGHWQFHKCTFNSNWDSATISNPGATHVLDLIDCTITAVGPPVGSSGDVRPVTATGGLVRCWNCTISGTGAASTGKKTYAVKTRQAGFVVVIGGSCTGADYDFGTEDASRIIKIGVSHAGSVESGARVTDLSPATDWSRLINKTTTNNLSGTTTKNVTDIATTLGTPAGASLAADIASVATSAGTASTNTTTLLARIGSFTGTGVNTVLGFLKAAISKSASTPSDVGGTFDASTDSTEAIRDNGASVTLSPGDIQDIADAVAAEIGTVSAANVDKDHTWNFDSPSQVTSPKIITEVIGFVGLAQMDFTEPMPSRSSISSITSATFANIAGTEPTVSSTAMSTDKRKVLLSLDASAATAGTYTVSVKIVTTDSQTFVRKGQMTIT